MLRLYDFKCHSCGAAKEDLVDSSHIHSVCECGWPMIKVISPVRVKLDGTDPDFPGAYNAWPKRREKELRNRRKRDLLDPNT